MQRIEEEKIEYVSHKKKEEENKKKRKKNTIKIMSLIFNYMALYIFTLRRIRNEFLPVWLKAAR